MRAAWLLLLLGCSPPARYPPAVPAPPVLDEAAPVLHRRLFVLRGNVSPDAVVRLYLDSSCAGPVYRQLAGAALQEGVEVELITGVDNVFTADAVSQEGGVSACSRPLSVRYVPAQRPGQPSVSLTPQSPSRSWVFTLRGAIDLFARAQLHEDDCSTPVVRELDAERFFSTGFEVVVKINGARTLAVDAVNGDQRSGCVVVTATNDSLPPVFSARLASPTPTSSQYAWLVLKGERVVASVHYGLNCGGDAFSSCSNCYGNPVFFSPFSTEFSVRGTDEAGNSTCLPGSKPWQYDATVPEAQAIVLLPGNPPQAEVPVGLEYVELFHSADCSGLRLTDYPWAVAWDGVYLPGSPQTGFVTARGIRPDGGVDPCSNALPLGP